MRLFLAGVVLSVAMSTAAQAQTVCPAPCALDVGKSFSVLADHGGVDTVGYRVYVDNVQVGTDVPVSALVAGTVTMPTLTAPARGPHTLQVAAYNLDRETRSAALAITTRTPAPTAPTNQRIIISVSLVNGAITFEVLSVEPLDVAQVATR